MFLERLSSCKRLRAETGTKERGISKVCTALISQLVGEEMILIIEEEPP